MSLTDIVRPGVIYVKAGNLQLGDTVRLAEHGEFMDAVVQSISPEGAGVFRPYATTANFSYGKHGGGTQVIPYIGIEQFVIPSGCDVILLRRGDIKL
jgi:hypothetical protein